MTSILDFDRFAAQKLSIDNEGKNSELVEVLEQIKEAAQEGRVVICRKISLRTKCSLKKRGFELRADWEDDDMKKIRIYWGIGHEDGASIDYSAPE